MRPDQLGDFSVPSDPQMHPDGSGVAFVVTRMDVAADRYLKQIWVWNDAEARPLTSGPSDSAPRWSPDGTRLAFLRKLDGDDAQVAILRMDGGDAEIITAFALGVTELMWSPDGSRLAVVAHEYDEPDVDDAERERRPRRITELPIRTDNQGWVHDRKSHVWVLGAAGESVCLTPGPHNETSVAWHPSGTELAFISSRHDDGDLDGGTQVWTVPSEGGVAEARTEVGIWHHPSYDAAGRLHAVGSPDRRAMPDVFPLYRVDAGPVTSLDRNMVFYSPAIAPPGIQWLDGGAGLSVLEDEGRVHVIRVEPDGSTSPVVGGDRVITGVSPRRDGSAAAFVAHEPTNPGELWWWEGGEERQLTDLNKAFCEDTQLVAPSTFTIDHDDVTVPGWIYLPPGTGKVPVLLNIHGGPATQYGYGFFDEFQIYVAAGYGVVATNPRGSSGYGAEFMRSVVGRWDEETPPDVTDLLAAVDAAAAIEPRLDPDRLGVMGGSYGGLSTVRLLARDHRYKSAVAERGVYSWMSFSGTSDIAPWFDRQYLGGELPADWERWWNASPLAEAHRITTPTLVLHSDGDWRTPVEQAQQLYVALRRAGVPTELVRFPEDEGHELSRSGSPRHRVERFEVILDWHARWLT